MEASDAFGAGVEIGEEHDPFEGSDSGDFWNEGDAPAAETEPPVVDREGNPVEVDANGTVKNEIDPATGEAAPLAADPTPAPGPAPASDGPTEVAADPTPPSTASSPATPASGSSEPGGTASSPTESAPAASAEGTPASTVEPAGATAEQVAGDQGDPTPTSSEQPPTEPGSDSPSSEPEAEEAPVPTEPTDAKGRATKRRYVILRVDAPGKFSQVDWWVDDKGKMSPTKQPGFKRQTIALARGVDEALKIGYVACGAPPDGVKLVPVAALHFQPKSVKPKPPEPARQRLSIT